MSAMEEALAALAASAHFNDRNARLDAIRASGKLSADADAILNELEGANGVVWDPDDYPVPLLISNILDVVTAMHDSLETYLAQEPEYSIDVERPASVEEPVRVSLGLRYLLLALLALGMSFSQGCTTRPRINAAGDVHYETHQTITIGSVPGLHDGHGASDLPKVLGQAFRLAGGK